MDRMQSFKVTVPRWHLSPQLNYHHLINSKVFPSGSTKKSQKNNDVKIPLPSNNCDSSTLARDYEKLRQKMWEMKHHVCLLEFGLGSVATLIQELNNPQDSSSSRTNSETHLPDKQRNGDEENKGNEDNTRYKLVVQGIGEVLQDIESSFSAVYGGPTFMGTGIDDWTWSGQHAAVPNVNLGSTVSQPRRQLVEQVDEQRETIRASENCQTADLCNINIVENDALSAPTFDPSSYHYDHQQPPRLQKYIKVNEKKLQYCHQRDNERYVGSLANLCMPSSCFDALSTLASVAASQYTDAANSTKPTEKTSKRRKSLEKRKSNRDTMEVSISVAPTYNNNSLSQETVNPTWFVRDEERVPPKKRRCITTHVL